MRRALVIVAVLAGLVLPASAALASEGGSFGIRLVDAPTDRRDDPRAEIAIVDHVSPGDEISRRVEIVSDHAEPLDVRVQPGAAELRAGEFLAVDDDAETNELVAWTTIDPAVVHVEPFASEMATVTIRIPTDAAAGERYGVVWAAVGSDRDSGPITRVNRVGVRMYLSVGEGGEPASDFEITELVAVRGDGEAFVEARVRNTGGRALDIGGELALVDGPGGVSAGPFPRARAVALEPGASGAVRFDVPADLPDGPWRAMAELQSGSLERTAEADVSFAGDEATSGEPVDTPDQGVRGPAVIVAIGLFLLVLLMLLVVLLRRRGDDDEDGEAEVEPSPARTPVGA